jgi:hypothetical protein
VGVAIEKYTKTTIRELALGRRKMLSGRSVRFKFQGATTQLLAGYHPKRASIISVPGAVRCFEDCPP